MTGPSFSEGSSDASSDTPRPGAELELTGTTVGAVVKVNEARVSKGLSPLKLDDGTLDPDGFLSVAEYIAKLAAKTAVATAAGEARVS